MLCLGHIPGSNKDATVIPIYLLYRHGWLTSTWNLHHKNCQTFQAASIFSQWRAVPTHTDYVALCVEYVVIILQRIHGADCLRGYRPISENRPTTSCYTMQNLQETSSDWRKVSQTWGIISGSLMTRAVKEGIKGALLLHTTDALMLQHVKSRQRAKSRLLCH